MLGPRAPSATMPDVSELPSRSVVSVSAASGAPVLAPESIASAYGKGLVSATATAQDTPLPTILGGTSLILKDSAGVERKAPLFFVSPTQVNSLVPAGTASGLATIQIGDLSGTAEISAVAPAVFSANQTGQGVAVGSAVRVRADGSQTIAPVFQCGSSPASCVSVPIDLGPSSDQVALVLYGTGLRGRSSLSNVTCTVGAVSAPVLFADAQGGFVGLDQVNLLLPRSLAGSGEVPVTLVVDGMPSNAVTVSIK